MIAAAMRSRYSAFWVILLWISSRNKSPIIITSATWELKRHETTVDHGDCDIDASNISMIVPMQTAGDYTLNVIAEIPPEKIIERFHITETGRMKK